MDLNYLVENFLMEFCLLCTISLRMSETVLAGFFIFAEKYKIDFR